MKLPAFEIHTLKAPQWLFVLTMFGFIKSNSIDVKYYGMAIIVILWTYQDFFGKEDKATKILKYSMRVLATAGIIASVLQPVS